MRPVPPILFLVFNRVDTTARVFESIRSVQPRRLYVAADGPRPGRATEVEQCEKARATATCVDWPCEVKTLFRDENLGCKRAVSEALSWFFDNEEEGIILEDDCLPCDDFYQFCAEMLDRYRGDQRMAMITGNNFQSGKKRGEDSYYFSKYTHIWGWACWRDTWRFYDGAVSFWPEWKRSRKWRELSVNWLESAHWKYVFANSYSGNHDSWAYPWMASMWYRSRLTITPNVNLVENIGFTNDATHTTTANSALSVKSGPLGEISHPSHIARDIAADNFVFNSIYRESVGSILRKLPAMLGRKFKLLRER